MHAGPAMRILVQNATVIPYVSIVMVIHAQPAMATLHSALIATEICHVMSATETVLSALHATAIHAIYAMRTIAPGATAILAGNATGTAALNATMMPVYPAT